LKLLGNEALERSAIVANNRMNRERGLVGGNGYAKDLGLNPLEWLLARLKSANKVSWLDLCCGSGKALIEASLEIRELGVEDRVSIVGVDLVPMFVAQPPGLAFLRLEEGSVTRWRPRKRFDLITCVHGLHYVGDKLGTVTRAASWLTEDGLLIANLDLASIKVEDCSRAQLARELEHAGLKWSARRRLLSREGHAELKLPYEFVGADDAAGPNYTGQPAVDSYYRRMSPSPSGPSGRGSG
jgi:SAM-dependent methyltransferase